MAVVTRYIKIEITTIAALTTNVLIKYIIFPKIQI